MTAQTLADCSRCGRETLNHGGYDGEPTECADCVTELARETPTPALSGDFDVIGSPTALSRSAVMARELALAVVERKWATTVNGKLYPHVEAWTSLGAIVGVLPREVSSHDTPDGAEATVELVRYRDGAIVGRATAICCRDEKRWAKAERHALRSMAITRAVSKAYRMGFSWLMVLAGLEATPAEEMVDEPAEPLATAEQVSQLLGLRKAMAIPDVAWRDILAKRDVDSVARLTQQAATELAAKLTAMRKEKSPDINPT